MGGIPLGTSPGDVTEQLRLDIPKWAKLVQLSGIKCD